MAQKAKYPEAEPVKSFKAGGIEYKWERTITTSIAADYLDDAGSRWGVWEMMREVFQNCLDEATIAQRRNGGKLASYMSFDKDTQFGWLDISDKGRGVGFDTILLLGISGKRNDAGLIGEKGEGEVMSFLVAARLGISKWMFSQDWAAKARIAKFENTDHQVLVIDLLRATKKREGTRWLIKLTADTEKYFDSRGKYFPALKPAKEVRAEKAAEKEAMAREARENAAWIASRPKAKTDRAVWLDTDGGNQKMYCKGVYVRDTTALFSYNLKNVQINRDRSMVSEMEWFPRIQSALASNDLTLEMAKKYWSNIGKSSVAQEYLVRVTPATDTNRQIWLAGWKAVFGDKACYPTGDVYVAADATNDGWKVVSMTDNVKALAMSCGVKSDKQAAGFGSSDVVFVQPTEVMTKRMEAFKQIAELLGIKTTGWAIYEKVIGKRNVVGYYSPSDKRIYMRASDFATPDVLEQLKTYIHELGHYNTNKGDFDRAFTDWFLSKWVELMTKPEVYSKVNALVKSLS